MLVATPSILAFGLSCFALHVSSLKTLQHVFPFPVSCSESYFSFWHTAFHIQFYEKNVISLSSSDASLSIPSNYRYYNGYSILFFLLYFPHAAFLAFTLSFLFLSVQQVRPTKIMSSCYWVYTRKAFIEYIINDLEKIASTKKKWTQLIYMVRPAKLLNSRE